MLREADTWQTNEEEIADTGGRMYSRMWQTALVCSRAGEHEAALGILKEALAVTSGRAVAHAQEKFHNGNPSHKLRE